GVLLDVRGLDLNHRSLGMRGTYGAKANGVRTRRRLAWIRLATAGRTPTGTRPRTFLIRDLPAAHTGDRPQWGKHARSVAADAQGPAVVVLEAAVPTRDHRPALGVEDYPEAMWR